MVKILKVTLVLALLFCLYLIYTHFTYEFYYTNGEKDGDVVTSPNEAYSAQVYYQNYGGAAGGVNAFVNVIFHLEGDLERTVYFSDAKGRVQLNWLGEDLLSITNYDEYGDRSIELVVEKEIYEEDGGACDTYEIKQNYVCFSRDQVKNGI
ncbi:DUF5412 family protein [Planococcus versutus]|uniref:DUF5412 domain-containing protein n=1 Tax=Planococcus versutus TaxID=1302659 RepID=A0A1B1S1K6_9BACL|nr:DUF5412 family protein [Planococcus versutus]ANU27075.1 hypothetical protein I858_008735 [Planococcus versutus]